MQFRRNGLRDERRRRALMEDRVGDVARRREGAETTVGAPVPSRTYSKSAVDERRVRIVDAVPVYAIHVASLYAVLVALTAGLLALHYYVGGIIRWADLGRVDSLGTWLASGGLFVGALTAFLIFRIRRHRLDDYRGRYRCWLWFTGLLLFASLDTVLNFRSDVAMGLESLTQMRLLGRTDAWWAVVWSVAFGAMAVRAALEVRESRGTLVVGALAGASLATAVGLQLDLLLLPEQLSADLAPHTARLAGLSLLVAALVQYARYVWLDAQGLIVHETRTVADAATDGERAVPGKRQIRTAAKKPTAKKVKARAKEEEESQESETPRPRGWFSFGRKKAVEDAIKEEREEDSSKVAAKSQRTNRTTAREVPPQADNEDSAEEEVKPKRSWFSFGRKKPAETEDAQHDEDSAKPAPAKPAKVKRPLTRKEAVESGGGNEAAEAAPAKRSWFSFGSKKAEEETPTEEKAVSAKSKTATAKPSSDEDEATEKPTRKSWFGWGKNAAQAEETEDTDSPRKTMAPRITTRPKAATPPPTSPTPPTITGKYSAQDEDADDESGESDEEILRLEAKPDHLLSKAERRRLKKLKRRAA